VPGSAFVPDYNCTDTAVNTKQNHSSAARACAFPQWEFIWPHASDLSKVTVLKSETQTSFFSYPPLPLCRPAVFSLASTLLIGVTCVHSDQNVLPDVTFVSQSFQTRPSAFQMQLQYTRYLQLKRIPEDTVISVIKHSIKKHKITSIFWIRSSDFDFCFSLVFYFKNCKDLWVVILRINLCYSL
jgi:hypothetical protein